MKFFKFEYARPYALWFKRPDKTPIYSIEIIKGRWSPETTNFRICASGIRVTMLNYRNDDFHIYHYENNKHNRRVLQWLEDSPDKRTMKVRFFLRRPK